MTHSRFSKKIIHSKSASTIYVLI